MSIEPKPHDDVLLGASGPLSLIMAVASSALASLRLRSLLHLLAPWPHKTASSSPDKLRPTAYLDGLRGFAAFLVYWHHHQLWAHVPAQAAVLEQSYGYGGEYYFAALPFVRNFFHGGHYAVAVFFVISGYVLSAKPISLIQAGEQAKLADNLGSALFRRWMRLYIPILCTTFIYMTFVHAFGIWIDGLEKRGSYPSAVWEWYAEIKNFSFVFNGGKVGWLSYNFHLWSIPTEFKGSIVIYTCLLALARCSRNARLWCEAGLIFYFMYIVDGWYCALFTAGMLLNDLDQLAAKDDLPAFFDRFRPYKTTLFYTMFAAAMYLGGCPAHSTSAEELRKNPGWYLLSFLKPQAFFDVKWFFLFWAAVFTVSSTPHVGWLKRFFETRFCQYLGRVSFSLYLVHGPVLWTLGDRLYSAVGWPKESRLLNIPQWVNAFPLPTSGPLGLEIAFWAPHIILLPVTFYVAELVTRAFDEPSVRFPQWLYKTATSAARPARLPA
ncbi:acyltransferase family-domain-containing protein [Staphylotrichum tortipilum]|uniref:Acyltransferase family-domain-containing protein n=1 Tax=Staphylotrichum tortipilum TaxID=2831512 RepID=A0AAN6MDH2_9PEZI|nr:acyltransferase family-domain-containing protein [Staphylotrichum longicolle]